MPKPQRISLRSISTEAIAKAIKEFDRIGRDAFLKKYQFGKSNRFMLRHSARDYDSKAIVGAAAQHTEIRRALMPNEFSGGSSALGPLFRRCGYVLHDARE